MQVLSLLLPLRYDFVRFGGSWAHRQILSVTIIQAAIKSGQLSLALGLVAELKVPLNVLGGACSILVCFLNYVGCWIDALSLAEQCHRVAVTILQLSGSMSVLQATPESSESGVLKINISVAVWNCGLLVEFK